MGPSPPQALYDVVMGSFTGDEPLASAAWYTSTTSDQDTSTTSGSSSSSDPLGGTSALTVAAPTLYDTSGLFWPRLPSGFVPPGASTANASRTTAGSSSSDPTADSSTSGDSQDQDQGDNGAMDGMVVQYGAQEGEICSLDMGLPSGLVYCAPGLVGQGQEGVILCCAMP